MSNWNKEQKQKVLDETFSKLEPIVNTKTGEIEKFECLVRHKTYTPNEILANISNEDLFLKQLEDVGKLVKEKNIRVSLNIDNNVLQSKKVYEKLSEFKHNELSNIEFEILESNIDLKSLKKFSNKIENLGIKINIDDFGSKEQTMERVKNIHDIVGKKLKSIKLDGELVKDFCKNDEMAIDAINEIKEYATKHNIKITAEFIENKEMFEKMKEVSDYTQGYLYGSLFSNLENFDDSLKYIQKDTHDKLHDYLSNENVKKKSKKQ